MRTNLGDAVRALSAQQRLGIEARHHRLRAGITQRGLATRLGFSAHSNMGEYERGLRLPPLDVVNALETQLGMKPGMLSRWHARALIERAQCWYEQALTGESVDSKDRATP